MEENKRLNEIEPVEQRKVSYSQILEELNVELAQKEKRTQLLKEIGQKEFNYNKTENGVIAHISHAPLSPDEIPVLGNVLLKIGDVNTLNLILHSPGGDGTIVEKFVSLCRAQCKRFRVLIPNEAKSAATLIALGADEIVMGPSSEIGPIDAQIEVAANGVLRYISAQSFIDARDDLLDRYKTQIAAKEDTGATMQMLATLDLPFIAQCEKLMDFGRDVAKKFLKEYMFKGQKAKQAKIDNIVKTLSSVERFKVHGRIVDSRIAKTEFGLNVKMCGKNDPLWARIWEYYTRAEMALIRGQRVKVFETEHELLIASMPVS